MAKVTIKITRSITFDTKGLDEDTREEIREKFDIDEDDSIDKNNNDVLHDYFNEEAEDDPDILENLEDLAPQGIEESVEVEVKDA